MSKVKSFGGMFMNKIVGEQKSETEKVVHKQEPIKEIDSKPAPFKFEETF